MAKKESKDRIKCQCEGDCGGHVTKCDDDACESTHFDIFMKAFCVECGVEAAKRIVQYFS